MIVSLALACLGTKVLIHDTSTGCYHFDDRSYERTLSEAEFAELRRIVSEAPAEVPDLLASVGITPESVAAKRDAILGIALPSNWKRDGAALPELLPELEQLLTYEAIAPHARSEVLSENWGSTSSFEFEVRFPAGAEDSELIVSSKGLTPGMLPWTISSGDKTWSSPDIRVTRALARLAEPKGPCAGLLMDHDYWSDGFYRNGSFWRRWIGKALDEAFAEERYAELVGFAEAHDRFEVEKVMTGNVNMQPEAMYFQLETRHPSLIDDVRWWNLLEEGAPAYDWQHLLGVYDGASRLAERIPWLLEWKIAGPERSIRLEVVGERGTAGILPDTFLHPPWKHSGFEGAPDFGLLLGRGKGWIGTLHFNARDPRVLVTRAKPSEEGEHWLDRLDLSYHPRGTPSYAVVHPDGRHELRSTKD